MCGTCRRAEGLGLLMPFGAQAIPSRAPDTGHRALRFGVFPAGFWSCFNPVDLCYCVLEVCTLFIIL